MVTKLKNSNCDKTQNYRYDKTEKTQTMTKHKKSNCDKTHKIKL